ncbi:MAG: MFS transporter [Erysipelotrichaceae bacterium]|nr:MFS transporter [Erysipelotrichaceae bacterium]
MKKQNLQYLYIVLICMGLYGSSCGILGNSVGVFYTPVAEDLGVFRGSFAMHMTMQSLAGAGMSLIIPGLMKRFPLKSILWFGVLATTGSTLLMGFANKLWQFNVLGILRGISLSTFSVFTVTYILNNWFVKNHGIITSCVMTISGLAGAVLSPLFSVCIESFGWRISYGIMAVINLLFGLPALFLPIRLYPEEMGFSPYGGINDETEKTEKTQSSEVKYLGFTFISVFIISMTCNIIVSMTQHFPGYAQSLGYSATVGAFMVTAVMTGNISSKLIIGIISDKFGSIRSNSIMIALTIAAMVALLTGNSDLFMYGGAFLFGFIYSISAVGIALLIKDVFGKENYSKTYPICAFAMSIGGAVSTSLIGYSYDFFHTYTYAIVLMIVFQVINIFLLVLLRKKNETKDIKAHIV